MDAVKLKNSCICGNTRPYAECCGPYGRTGALGEGGPPDARRDFRRDLHDLSMYLFPHRNLYQAYWERLSQEEYPHHLLMADPDYGRAVIANFFWDYSVQFSDARPILRAARDVEDKDLRLANDFRQWSLSPLWLWTVIESDGTRAHVRMAGAERTERVEHGGELPAPGGLFAGRILPHRGRMHVHPGVLVVPEEARAVALQRVTHICRALGVRSGVGLRPDVHCDEWRRHGALVLALWRELTYDAKVGIPARTMAAARSFRLPLQAPSERKPGGTAPAPAADGVETAARLLHAGGAVALGARRFDVRYRALTLARLELESPASGTSAASAASATGATEAAEGWLNVTLLDEAYRPYLLHWLADHLDTAARASASAPAASASSPPAAPSDWIAWAQSAQDALGGETPLEAASHDFGRRRLDRLLAGLALPAEERAGLRRHLGLGGPDGAAPG